MFDAIEGTPTEKQEVVTNCDHLARVKFSKALPFAFTEHGAIQAAKVLNSEQAIEIGVYVARDYLLRKQMREGHDSLEGKRMQKRARLIFQESTFTLVSLAWFGD